MNTPQTERNKIIRDLYATGEHRMVDLAKRFGISQARISKIVNPPKRRSNKRPVKVEDPNAAAQAIRQSLRDLHGG